MLELLDVTDAEPFFLVQWDRNLHVPVDPLPWPKGTCERMSMNSFGLGGSNVHVGSSSRCLI